MSTKPVAEKLLIRPGSSLWVSDPAYEGLVEPLPPDVTRAPDPGQATTALVVAPGAATLREALDAHGTELARPAALWVLYPKGNRTDVNRDTLWPILSAYGLRPVTQVAVDDVWSALRFRPLRDGEPPFTGGR